MIEQLLGELKGIRGKKILLQVPEGLKHKVDAIVDCLKGQNNEVYVDIDPCFGACDVRDREAQMLGVDLLVHVGHTPLPHVHTVVPVKYVELRLPVNIDAVVRTLSTLEGKIALCSTVQYVHALDSIKKRLPDKIFYKKGRITKYPGQILGCDASACDVDADINVFLGDGVFHAIAMYLNRKRPTFVVSPNGELRDVTKECKRFDKVRIGLKARAYEAEKWGVVVSTKPGQINMGIAHQIKRASEEIGKRADILVCDYFYPEYVRGMPYDVYVFTGCPRVALDDWKNYDKPVITPTEALEVIKWAKERHEWKE